MQQILSNLLIVATFSIMNCRLHITFFVLFLVTFCGLQAQTVLRSSLGMSGSSIIVDSGNQSYFISQSIGQVGITGTYKRNKYTIRQGYQQPLYSIKPGLGPDLSLNARIYPNPFNDWLHIDLPEHKAEPLNVLLLEMSGRTILHQDFSSTEKVTIQLSTLEDGIYILRVISGGKFETHTLIKNSHE